MANEYWAKRIAETQEKLTTKNIKQTEKKLADIYHATNLKVQGDFEAVYNKLFATMAAGQEPTPADLYKLQKYWELQTQLTGVTNDLAAKQIKKINTLLKREYLDIYHSINFDNKDLFATLSKEGINKSINSIWCADGKSWSDRIWSNTAQLKDTLLDQLTYSISTGKKPAELNELLQHRFDVSFSQADTVVRTEMCHIQTEAAQQRYKDYGIQYVEVLAEDAGCDECAEMDGKRFLITEQMPLPLHPNCRCCIVPVVE